LTDRKPAEDCGKYQSGLSDDNDDDPSLVPSESHAGDKRVKRRVRRGSVKSNGACNETA